MKVKDFKFVSGRIYYVKYTVRDFDKDIEHIFIVHGLRYNGEAYNATCIASTSHLTWDGLSVDDYPVELKEIPKSDLPLYIGWPKISPQFKDYI